MNCNNSIFYDRFVYITVAMFALFLAYSEFFKNLSIVMMLAYFLHQLIVKNLTITKDLVNISIFSYFFVIIFGIWTGINAQETIAQASDMLKILIVFLFFREVTFRIISLERIIRFVVLGFIITIIYSMVDYYLNGGDYLKLHSVGSINRSATYIVYIFVTTLVLFPLYSTKVERWLLLFGLLFSGMAIILGGSRMAMFTLPVIILVYAFLKKKSDDKYIFLIIMLFILLLGITFLFFPDSRVALRFEQGFNDPARTQIWISSIYAWLENDILFGIGVGNSIFIDVGDYFENPITRNIDNAHHLYLDLLLEKGLLGFISFFTFISSLWFFKIEQSSKILIKLLIFSMCLMGLANITFRYEFALLFVMIVGSLLNPTLQKKI